jgi:uncharacterized protein YhaN
VSELIFRRVGIRRIPGVDEGAGFELRELASGINVVYGPNASGKTTTVRALEALVWPRAAAPESARLDAAVDLGGQRWSIRLDAGLVAYQRDGVEAPAPPTAPAEARDRYRLCLGDLLRADDVGLARAILVESSGGFDLERAAAVLEPRRPHHRQRAQQAELRRARERVRQARAEQEGLSRDAQTLAVKEARLASRSHLERRLQVLRRAADHAESRAEAELTALRLQEFPAAMPVLVGDEAARLAELRRRRQDAAAGRERAEAARAKAARDLRGLQLPQPVVDGDLLHRLIADVDRLVDVERTIESQDGALHAATARLAEEEKPLRPLADPGRLAALGLQGLADLEKAAAAADDARLRTAALRAELAQLPAAAAAADVTRLREGVLLLRQWLRSSAVDRTTELYFRRLGLAGVLVIFVAAIALALLIGAGAGALAAAGGAALLAALLARPGPPDPLPDWERQYLRLQLAIAPDAWQAVEVEACLARLEETIAEASELQRAAQRMQALTARLGDAEREEEPMAEALRQIGAEFGLQLPAEAVRLYWLVERIGRWQRARAERLAAEAEFVQASAVQREILASANERLGSIGVEPVNESRSLKGTVERLREKLITHQRISHALTTAEAEVGNADAEDRRLRHEIDLLLERVGITAEDEPRLAAWCERVEEYRTVAKAHDRAEARCRELEGQLRETVDLDPALLEAPRDEVLAAIADLQAEADDLLTLGQEVGGLRSRIEAAKRAHALEDALAEEQRCREALEEIRLKDLRSGVAAVLLDFLERETRNEHLPEVFHRANQLFARITRGAYELRVESGDPPSFRAYDTRSEKGLALEELSSGTRVQLLLAVRIAFVESREAGVRLPLLMDEALANSDDERASAIMAAVIQLALDGRQVFYFTAQPDEVAKWRRALQAQPAAEFAVIDLALERSLEQRLKVSDLDAPVAEPVKLPAPSALSHGAYGEALGVPRVEIGAPIGALHLWYLVEDPRELHRILGELRVTSWGELRSLLALDGGRLLEERVLQRVEAAARVAATALDLLRVGRGRRVDRRAVLASGVVTARFVEEVESLVTETGGDAAELLRCLEEGAVPKFLRRNVDALRHFFEENGYLDPREPSSPTRLRLEVLSGAAALLAAGRIDVPAIDRLLGRLRAGTGLIAEAATDEPDPPRERHEPDRPAETHEPDPPRERHEPDRPAETHEPAGPGRSDEPDEPTFLPELLA